jgi:hypothetical protein
MNTNGVLTTKAEVKNSGGSEYLFPTEDMTFKGKLDSRSWGKKFCLVCNFTAEDGRKIKLIGFGRKEAYGNVYGPKKCQFNFADDWVEGMIFTCTVRINSKGRHVWVSAE